MWAKYYTLGSLACFFFSTSSVPETSFPPAMISLHPLPLLTQHVIYSAY